MGRTNNYKPVRLDLSKNIEHEKFEAYKNNPSVSICDSYNEQLRNLVKTRNPSTKPTNAQIDAQVQTLLDGCPISLHGRWIYYPWSKRLVHLLEEKAFHELRSNRNQHKILAEDQKRLRTMTIGIVGLSVGHSAAMTLVLEGIGGHYRLADFDELDLSNLNRIRTGVHNLGINKAIMAAREMFELDPYIDVEIFLDGVTTDNIEDFFCKDGKLDLLVEECDDLHAKVKLRERARELRIPVVMDTSDGGILDIERFDLEPKRELFHGALPNIRADDLLGLSTKEKVPFVLAILGIDQLSPEFAASLIELDKTLSTWPQLGSSVMLGGALVAHAARRVLLNQLQCSGRFSVDLKHLINNQESKLPQKVDLLPTPSKIALQAPVPPPPPSDTSLSKALIEYLLKFAIRAPSGGNTQPWQFVWKQQKLYCYVDPNYSSTLDFRYSASQLAIGAAVENIVLAAQDIGYTTHVNIDTTTQFLACSLQFEPSQRITSSLFPYIFSRSTNRNLGNGTLLTEDEISELTHAAQNHSGDAITVNNRKGINTIGALLGEVDRLRFLSPTMHAELISELRWTNKEVEQTLDGIDIDSLEMSASDRSGLQILKRPDVMKCLEKLGGGRGLSDPARKACESSSAILLVTIPKTVPFPWVHAGRIMQSVWLTATKLNLAVCPQGVLFFLLARVQHGNSEGLPDANVAKILEIGEAMRNVLGVSSDMREAMLFRLSRAKPPSVYSLRRNLNLSQHED